MRILRLVPCGLLHHGRRRGVIGVAVGLALIALMTLRGCEPTWGGRTLTSWLTQCHETPMDEAERLEEAQKAVRAMGANRVWPILIKMAEAHDGPLRSWMISKSTEWDIPYLKNIQPAEDVQRLGFAGFEALGAEAAPAVGELTRLLDHPEYAYTALQCLWGVGKPADLAICRSLTNRDSRVRRESVLALAWTTADAELYIARLKDSLKDSSSDVRFAAVEAIGNQTDVPEASIPLLITALEDPSDHVSSLAAKSLSGFGTNATCAFQALSNVAESGSEVTASSALRALTAIVPAETLPVLLRNITASETRRRRVAARLLGSYKVATAEMLSALESGAADPDAQVVRNATYSLRKLRPFDAANTNNPPKTSWPPLPEE